MVTALALHPEDLLAASQSGLCIPDADTGEVTRRLGDPTEDRRGIRFNDGKCDSQCRFWVGTLALNLQPGAGALYVMDGPESFRRVASGLTLPNGIGWSPDDRVMYLVDTSDRTVYAYDFDATRGNIANRRPFHVFSPQAGSPDGLAVNGDGNLWIALWDGWRVVKVTPDGRIGGDVMPVPRPTSCALGGRTVVACSRHPPGSGSPSRHFRLHPSRGSVPALGPIAVR